MSNRKPSSPVLFFRSLLFWIVFALSILLYWIPVCCSVVLPIRKRYDIVNLWVKFNLWWLRVSCDIDHRVKGVENIYEPAIVYAKHQSTWETLALKTLFPHAVYVAKRELLWVPFFGWAFSVLDFININRAAGRKVMPQLIEQAKTKIANGFSITIFPEGTRTAVGAPPVYKMGGSIMAVESGAPIVPVAHNAGLFWPRRSFIKYPGTVTISIGPKIESTGRTPEQLRDLGRDWIEREMQVLLAQPDD
jgi:1-acyl-sn-glycerol-3-phosphate acyltransferase